MADWWASDPIVAPGSAVPQPQAPTQAGSNWWDKDPIMKPGQNRSQWNGLPGEREREQVAVEQHAKLSREQGVSAERSVPVDDQTEQYAQETRAREQDINRRVAMQEDINSRTMGTYNKAVISGIPFSDEFGAIIGAPRGLFNGNGVGEEYDREMIAQERINNKFARENPGTALALRTVGGLVSMGPTSPGANAIAAAPNIANMAKTGAIVGGVAGAGEGRGVERLENSGIGATLGLSLSALGGVIANRVGSAVTNTAPQISPGRAAIIAAERQGVPLPRVAASDNRAVQMAGQGLGGTFAGAAIPRALQESGDAVAARVADLAKGVAPGGERIAVGGNLGGTLKNYVKNIAPSRVSEAYQKVDDLIDPAMTTPIRNTAGVSKNIAAQREAAALPESTAVKHVQPAIERSEGLTYGGVKDLRSNLGEGIKSGRLPADMAESEAKRLYAGLSDDLTAAVMNAGGPDAVAAQKLANRYARMMAGRSKSLDRALGNKSDEQIFDTIANAARAGGSENNKLLWQVRRSVQKEDWDNFTSATIQRLGRDQAGSFSPTRFVSDYENISKAAKNIMFGGKAGLREALDDLALVSGRLKQVDKLTNYSRTGNVTSATAFLAAGGGLMTAPITTLSTTLGANVMSRILARPAAVRGVSGFTKAYTRYVARPNQKAAFILAKNARITAGILAKEAGDDGYALQIEQALLSALKNDTLLPRAAR